MLGNEPRHARGLRSKWPCSKKGLDFGWKESMCVDVRGRLDSVFLSKMLARWRSTLERQSSTSGAFCVRLQPPAKKVGRSIRKLPWLSGAKCSIRVARGKHLVLERVGVIPDGDKNESGVRPAFTSCPK